MIALGEHALDAKAHERHRPAHERAHRLGALALHELGRIAAGGQLDDAQLELSLGGEGGRPQHGLLT